MPSFAVVIAALIVALRSSSIELRPHVFATRARLRVPRALFWASGCQSASCGPAGCKQWRPRRSGVNGRRTQTASSS